MPVKKPPESKSEARPDSISEDASFWLQQFLSVFEPHFIEICRNLGHEASRFDYYEATVRAVFETLRDSASDVDDDSIVAIVGKALIERRQGPVEWNAAMNQRRFELIDKEIQGSLTPAEQIELTGLTKIMREQLETEENLPIERARVLHRKLLERK